ncbi:transglycosylase SLT domain-containing protein [Desulfovibrio sp. PG-178-WT-4]|uniref:Transglycosylase SLT domain-containing protein n=1 Tax=Desulfovibrio porci TaxID=2605782 RepID=A0A6L5XIJ1_9BACT|nr:transglycosylase SLT domain-containing protein [Desulfovibrio porci]MSS27045.1 transglycosylase SLT domain-containing protein [Desulfovibrio porci]
MLRRKTLVILSLSLGGALLLLGLLAGFVPQSEGPEVRRRASAHVVSLRPEDLPEPILPLGDGTRLWAVRRAAASPDAARGTGEDDPALTALAGQAGAEQIISFEKSGVRLDMGGDELFFDEAAAPADLAPLLALDGVSMPLLVTAQPRQYGDALDARGRPLRWQAAETLLSGYTPLSPRTAEDAKKAAEEMLPEGAYFERGDLFSRARRYQQLVENFARRYHLSTELVYAIIHSESDFSPTLISGKSAMGLMQLLPSTASDEVHRFLYGRPGDVSFDELRVPEINIRYGTAYLHILLTRYFQDVSDPLAREYCAVAAYNMGPNRFLRLYGKTGGEAVARINAMSAEELYEDLTARLPVRETRFYVAKVRRMKGQYAELR